MDEQQFAALADAELAAIEAALEARADDFDIDVKPGGIVEVGFDDGAKIIINRHLAAREIWVAARSGGYHFRPQDDGRWVSARDGEELRACIGRCLATHGAGNGAPLA